MKKHLYQEHFELEGKHWWFISKKKIILSFIKDYLTFGKNSKILDIGCGPGLMLNDLTKLGQVSAMDFSHDAIEFCKTKNACDLRQGSLPNNVPFDKGVYDLVICLDVIEHVDDDYASVKTLNELLAPNGKMVITVPALMSLWSKWDEINEHKRRYDLEQFRKVLLANNFEIEKISYYNSFLFPLVYLIRWVNRTFKKDNSKSDTEMPGAIVNFLLTKIFSFERFVLKVMSFPVGVSLIAVVRKK